MMSSPLTMPSAYNIAALTSSAVMPRSSVISLIVQPSASLPRIASTVTLVPVITGFPTITLGFTTILFMKSFSIILKYQLQYKNVSVTRYYSVIGRLLDLCKICDLAVGCFVDKIIDKINKLSKNWLDRKSVV